jgi:outer membrane immunogenic protein
MRKTIVGAVAVGMLGIADSAMAADISTSTAFDWSGVYVGLNAGYGWSDNNAYLKGLGGSGWDPYYPDALGSKDLTASGFVGGLQAGYNFQIDQILLGVETDFRYSDVGDSSKNSGVPSVGDPFTYTQDYKLNWFGTTRARVGFALDRALLYATGGVAYGDVSVKHDLAFVNSNYYKTSDSEWEVGWTVGGGIEYAITDSISLKGEYLYYDLSDTESIAKDSRGPGYSTKLTTDNNGQIVAVGLNWHL